MVTINKSKSGTEDFTDTGTPSFLTICKSEVLKHLRVSYESWHNYALYQNHNNWEKATDVLNEVIFDIMQKAANKLYELVLTTFDKYTGLDMLILRAIKRNSINKSINYNHNENNN